MGWHWPAVIPARVRTAYWQANADGWTEFESVSAGCAGSRPVALRASSPRLAQLNGIKNQRMVRGQCAGWCRPGSHELVNSKPQETFGPILGAPPAACPHLTRPVNQYIANLNRFLLKSHFTNLARPAADEAISKQ